MCKTIKVDIIDKGKDGETMCFRLRDSDGNYYEIDNCHLKDTYGVFEGYSGSFEGCPAHLNILYNGDVLLMIYR